LEPPFNISEQLYDKPNEKTFFEFYKMKNNSYYCSALGNLSFKRKMGSIDDYIFADKIYQPEIRNYQNQ
jgi:hypothetical protein